MSQTCVEERRKLGLDSLVAIAGDGHAKLRARLDVAEGFKVIAIPKTMDNDVRQYREYCGGSRAAHFTRAAEAIGAPGTTGRLA